MYCKSQEMKIATEGSERTLWMRENVLQNYSVSRKGRERSYRRKRGERENATGGRDK